jgi:DNA-binding MurR/RpiR family transcriptional regulator
MPTPSPDPPASVEALLRLIAVEFEGLSRQLKVIARHIEQNRDQLGLEGIQDVARACGVQPSAVVRFAKRFGFSGFTEMQRLFRDVIVQKTAPGRDYQARIRRVIESGERTLQPVEIAQEFLAGSIAGMQQLRQGLDASALETAVKLLADADVIWVAGARRSFAVAAYLAYALQHTDKRIGLFAGVGCMQDGQLRSIRRGDVVIAVSFSSYAEETVAIVQEARRRGARIIAITDSRLSPLARGARALLLVQDTSVFGFRSMTSMLGLAQSLFIALAYRLELDYVPHSSVQTTRRSKP